MVLMEYHIILIIIGVNMSKRVWTLGIRLRLFAQIVKLFGKLDSWEGYYPEDRQKFDDFCESFAKIVGASSGKAVEMQIRFAVTTQKSVEGSYIPTFLSCKTAAIETGFIGKDRLPTTVLCEY